MFTQEKIIQKTQLKSPAREHILTYGAALLVGLAMGSLVFFVPPLYLALGVGGLIFTYFLFFQIELAIIIALLILDWLRDFNYLGNGTPFHPNGIMGLALIVGAVVFFVFNKIDFSRLIAIKYFSGFLVVSMISLLFAGEHLMEGLTVTLRLASGLAIYAILIYKTDSIKKAVRVMSVIIIALVWPTASGLIMIAQGQGDKFFQMDTARLGGGTSGPGVYLAMILTLCVVFFLEAKTNPNRLLWGSLCALFLIGLYFSYGRAGWIGFAAGMFVIAILKYKKILFVLPWLLILVILLVPSISARFSDIAIDQLGNRNSSTLAMRIELWTAGLAVFRANNPLFGVGFGVERYRVGEYLAQYAWMPHNDYIGILVGTGFIGFVFFMLWHGQWLIELFKVYEKARDGFEKTLSLAVLTVFVVSLVVRITDNIVQSTGRLYPLAALVAITLVLPRIRAEEESRKPALTTSQSDTSLAGGNL